MQLKNIFLLGFTCTAIATQTVFAAERTVTISKNEYEKLRGSNQRLSRQAVINNRDLNRLEQTTHSLRQENNELRWVNRQLTGFVIDQSQNLNAIQARLNLAISALAQLLPQSTSLQQ